MNNLSEEEKRRKALELFAAEQARLSSRRVFDVDTAAIAASLARNERKQEVKRSLAQRGITWE